MSDQPNHAVPPTDGAYIAQLWEYPQLTIAIFGIQVYTPGADALYEASGVPGEGRRVARRAHIRGRRQRVTASILALA